MPEWTIKNAAFFLFVAVGSMPVFAIEWTPELQVQGWLSKQEYNRDSPLSPQKFSQSKSSVSEAMVLFAPKVVLNSNVQGFLSTAAGYRKNSIKDGNEIKLLEGSLSIANDQQTNRISFGKMNIRWSQDNVYHPLDIFGRFNQPKSSLGINDFDYFKKEGSEMVRVQGTYEALSYEAILANAENNESMPASYQAAVRGMIQSGESEFSFIAEKSKNYRSRWGASISQGVGEQWTLYGEYLFSRDRDIPVLQQTSAEISLPNHSSMPARYGYQSDNQHQNWQKMLLTLRFYPLVGGSIEGSVFYNGHGMNHHEWSQWEKRQQIAASTLTNAQLRPYFQQGNPYISMLGDSARLMQNFYLRKFYTSVRWDSLERFNQGRIETNLIMDNEGGSLSLWTSMQYPVSDKLIVKPYLLLQSHARGEGRASPLSSMFGINFSLMLL